MQIQMDDLMGLREYRRETSMSRAEMVRKVQPHLKGFALSESLLARIEAGDVSDERIRAFEDAAQKAFPDLEPSDADARKRGSTAMWLTRRRLLLGALSCFGMGAIGLFVLYRDHPLAEDAGELISILSGLTAIIGFGLVVSSYARRD